MKLKKVYYYCPAEKEEDCSFTSYKCPKYVMIDCDYKNKKSCNKKYKLVEVKK